MGKRRNQSGLTLIELIVAFTILLILTSMAVPLARARVRSEKERELRRVLIEMRNAIDKYKDMADQGLLGPGKLGQEGYPESLEALVEGVKMTGQVDKKARFLQNVFDIYTKSTDKAADGTPYSEW
jgi:general secretion pathway protein G